MMMNPVKKNPILNLNPNLKPKLKTALEPYKKHTIRLELVERDFVFLPFLTYSFTKQLWKPGYVINA